MAGQIPRTHHHPCTRCRTFFDSRAVYRAQDLAAVAGTRARLCDNCTRKLIASGHIRHCQACRQYHSRGHVAPTCSVIPQRRAEPLWSYGGARAAGTSHGSYVRLWRRAKEARAAEIEGGEQPRKHQFGYGNFKTVAGWLSETRAALNKRINLKGGVDADWLGRKLDSATPTRLRGRGQSAPAARYGRAAA